jgi:hypothetical protein
MKYFLGFLLCIILLIAVFLGYKHFLPYGRLDKTSEFCRKPELFNNAVKCNLSGCNWGSGDLTGPPFCGAYK